MVDNASKNFGLLVSRINLTDPSANATLTPPGVIPTKLPTRPDVRLAGRIERANGRVSTRDPGPAIEAGLGDRHRVRRTVDDIFGFCVADVANHRTQASLNIYCAYVISGLLIIWPLPHEFACSHLHFLILVIDFVKSRAYPTNDSAQCIEVHTRAARAECES